MTPGTDVARQKKCIPRGLPVVPGTDMAGQKMCIRRVSLPAVEKVAEMLTLGTYPEDEDPNSDVQNCCEVQGEVGTSTSQMDLQTGER